MEEARHARASRDQANLNVKTAKDGMAFLKSKESIILRKIEEEEERKRVIEKELQRLNDQELANNDGIKDQNVEVKEAEVYIRKMHSFMLKGINDQIFLSSSWTTRSV